VHDDLVARQFTAVGPDRTWLTDITEHPTAEGKLYLCAIKDVYSNRIVGYSMDARMTVGPAWLVVGRPRSRIRPRLLRHPRSPHDLHIQPLTRCASVC
jgi:putative transposase